MLEQAKTEDILFIDIETVPQVADINQLNVTVQELWEEKKGKHRTEDENVNEYYFQNAGIFAEFGKIICISVG